MKITNHAKIRFQQRGMLIDHVFLILQFGTAFLRPGNVWEVKLDKKGKKQVLMYLKYLIQSIDKIDNKALVVSEDMQHIITGYYLKK
jgi:hypothetical protein